MVLGFAFVAKRLLINNPLSVAEHSLHEVKAFSTSCPVKISRRGEGGRLGGNIVETADPN